MYRVVRLSASLRAHNSNSNHNRWFALLGMGLFAAIALGSMTFAPNSAQAQCVVNSGTTDLVTCASDDTDGVDLTTDAPVIADVGTATAIGTLDITNDNGDVFHIETINDDEPIEFNIFSDDPFVPVRIEQLGTVADGDAVHLVTTTSDITFASQANSELIGTTDGLHAEATTVGNTAIINITSFSNITSTGNNNDNTTAAIELSGQDGAINLQQHGTTTANDDGALIRNVGGAVTAEFWGEIDAGDTSEDDGVDIITEDGAVDVTLHEGANIIDAGGSGLNLETVTGNVTARVNAQIGLASNPVAGDGVFINTTTGEVLVETDGEGDLNVAGHGVNATSVDNNVTGNVGENITAGLSAVRVGDGEVVTLNFGDATNTTKTIAGDGINNAVVNVADYDQDSSLTNYSTIRSTAATLVEQADDLAIDVTDDDDLAAFEIDNYNTIIGRIDGSAGANTVNNFSADSWIVAGVGVVNDFGDGEDVSNNFGRTVTALSADVEESVSFTNLEEFNNGLATTVGTGPDYGLLTMIDQSVGQVFMRDMTTYSGDGLVWTGGPNSQLGIDAFLGGASDTADLLVIEGDNAGTTAVRVNDINGGAGVYNPDGILFATVDGTSPEGSFFLSDGPIDKGFFTYDVIRNEAATVDWLLASAPNERAFELPRLVTGAQTIWHETTGVWLDRTADLRRSMECAPAPVAAVNHLPPLKLGPSDDGYAVATPCYQQRFGVWGRGFGADYDRSVTDRTTLTVTGSPATLRGNYNQDLAGAQGGADVVLLRPNSGYGALFVGVMGGFVESDMSFNATKDKANFDGGSVGVYGTYVAGPWYADLLFKADLLDLTYKTSFQSTKASSDADSFGIRFDTGYRFNTGPGFFLDPQGTLAWVDSDVGNLSLLNATTNFSDGESLRGRLGLRAGYSWLTGATIVEPFAVASVWHEFEGNNKVALMSNGFTLAFNDSLDETWGEIGGGLNVFSGGGSAFVKADALVGSDLEGWKVTGGGRLAW